MYRSEALAKLQEAQHKLSEAQDAVTYAYLDLDDAECDHPDTDGLLCTHCGLFHLPEGQLQADDDFRVLTHDIHDFRRSGLPNLAPYNSLYAYL